jgi:hypothetical protein
VAPAIGLPVTASVIRAVEATARVPQIRRMNATRYRTKALPAQPVGFSNPNPSKQLLLLSSQEFITTGNGVRFIFQAKKMNLTPFFPFFSSVFLRSTIYTALLISATLPRDFGSFANAVRLWFRTP